MRIIRGVIVAALVAASVAWPLAPQAAAFDGNASIELSKTVGASTLTPTLRLTFTVTHDRGIPGDQLAYKATVTNSGANAGLAGTFTAVSQSEIDSTIAAYYDEVEYFSGPDQKWIPFAVASAAESGYTVFQPPPAAGPMTLQLTSIASSGVTYPAAGDAILGTRIAKDATASWTYTASIPLAPAQLALLLDPTQARAVRNVVHFEVTPRKLQNGQPYVQRVDFTAQWRTLSSDLTNTVVTITPPSGPPVVAAIGALAPGASASATASFAIPVPAAKATGESDAAYIARLALAASTPLMAGAHASATAADGSLVNSPAPDPTVSASLLLPIVRITKQGPASADAGTTAHYTIGLQNTGSARAVDLAVDDVFPGGAHVTTSGVPATLDPGGAPVSALASFDIPVTQPVGDLSDTASIGWRDANANAYGPVSATFTTSVTASGAGSRLVLAPAASGPNVTGASQTLTVTATDKNGVPIDGLAVHLAITGANATAQDGTTNASGLATFTYTGTTRGDDIAQATATYRGAPLVSNTATIAWVTPIQPVTTTTVLARVFSSNGSGVFNTPKTATPSFTELVPTIDFNPPAGTVPHNTSGVGVFTRPYTNVTTDLQGNFTGAIPLEGNGLQAGVGTLFNFQLVLTGEFTIASAGDVTFNFFSDDGFLLGIANGATRVSGPMVNVPTGGITEFEGYSVVGSYNVPTAPVRNTIVVHFPAAGSYPYEVDYSECCAGELALTMTQGAGSNPTGVPPSGSLALTPITIAAKQVGQTQTLTVAAMDASGFAIVALPVVLSITGPNTQQIPATTDGSGIATFSYQGANAGTDHAQAGASLSGMPAISNIVNVPWSAAPAPKPTIGAVSPTDGGVVTAPVEISASFAPPSGQTIVSWSVTYRRAGTTTDSVLASGTGAPPATLATFDPTRVPNGLYAITITATASGGGVETATTNLVVDGALKLGHYVRTFRDLAVPLAGLPMEVLRSYDSLDKNVGDFGIGWHVDVASFRVATARPLGLGGWTQYNAQCFFGLCLTAFTTSLPHAVAVTWPDGHQEIFDFTPDGGTNIFWTGSAKFTGRPGTTSTLEALGSTGLDYFADGNLYSGGVVYDPQRFRLTASNGTAYVIDRASGLTSATDANGNTLNVSASGVVSSFGPSITFARDGLGRITTITGPSGQTLHYMYSVAGDLASFIDANGNPTTFTYDAMHDMTGMSGPAGPLRSIAYDADGRVTSLTDGAGNTTTVTNDVGARQQVITDPTGQLTTVLTYDDAGDLVVEDAIFGGVTLTTTYEYDSLGRLVRQTDPLGHAVSFTYDAASNLVSLVDAAGRATRFTYDARNRPTSEIAPDGTVTAALTYDLRGNLVRQQRVDGSAYTYAHDTAGHVVTVTDPGGRVSHLTYGPSGQLASVTDPGGQVVTYTSDGSGRTTAIATAVGTTTMSYDGVGNLAHVSSANGHPWTFTYNFLGDLVTATDPASQTTSYAYDAIGRLISRTDRTGDVTSYVYDAAGRVTSESSSGRITTLAYDPLGRPLSLGNDDARIAYAYDAAGRVVTETTTGTPTSPLPTVALTLTYDPSGLPLSVHGPEGTTSYAYDAAARIVAVTDANGGTFHFAYDSLGRLVGVDRPNGVSDALTYDLANQLISRVSSRGGGALASAAYTYDASGRRTSLVDPTGTHAFAYDSGGRLVSASHPVASGTPNETYSYDAVGNRLSSADSATNTYDSADRLIADAALDYTYDAKGRLVRRTVRTSGATTTYTWSADDLLLAVHNPDGTTTSYRYDPLGRRIEVNDAGQVTRYAYDGTNVRLEYDNSNAIVASYTTGFAPGSVLEMRRGGGAFYQLQDALGSTTALADAAGSVVATYAYDAFGRMTSSGGPANAYTFTGQQRDARTGLYYSRARYYDPRSGRFISQDPIQAIDPYVYAANDPLDFVDPTGAQAFVERAEIDAQRIETEEAIRELSWQLCGQILGAVLGLGLGPNAMGAAGEDYVSSKFLGGLAKNTQLLDPTGLRRIPDFIQRGFIEVKNVGRLAYTQQIDDLVRLLPKGEQLTIFVRGGTKLSGPLLDAIKNSGLIKVVRCLPG